jgi:tRNA A-37 threonylcarbamoyl transferase component Bud32
VLHGDVELRNFVVLGDDVKVIDFGFATLREADWEAVTAAERATLVKELDEAKDGTAATQAGGPAHRGREARV